ncbi:MAG: LytR/AlgR family response regulator transcription factor [Acidobacteriota bacterium]
MKTIMIMEDDPAVRENMQFLLEESGYDVVTAADGREGISLVGRRLPDMIVCDIMMPQMDGYQVLEHVRSSPETARIPFVFLTAKSELMDMRRGMQLGADDFILKPYKAEEVLLAIQTQLKKKAGAGMAPAPAAAPGASKPAPRPVPEHELFLAGSTPELFRIADITHIRAEEEYSVVFTKDGKKHVVRRLLKEWESALPAESFLRIHRSFLINLNYVVKMEKWENHSYRVFLKDVPDPLVMSRRYSAELRSKMKEKSGA